MEVLSIKCTIFLFTDMHKGLLLAWSCLTTDMVGVCNVKYNVKKKFKGHPHSAAVPPLKFSLALNSSLDFFLLLLSTRWNYTLLPYFEHRKVVNKV